MKIIANDLFEDLKEDVRNMLMERTDREKTFEERDKEVADMLPKVLKEIAMLIKQN